MATVLVTGASRGIGLELARQYTADAWNVVAAARKPEQSSGLRDLAKKYGAKLQLEALDVTSEESIQNLADALKGRAIDLLVNNAAIYPREGTRVGQLNYDSWGDALDANLFGV